MRNLVLVLAMGVSGVSFGTETEKKNKVTFTQSSYSSISTTDDLQQSSSQASLVIPVNMVTVNLILVQRLFN